MYNISIYIITHNRPQYILDAINSVLSQSYNDFNLIVSDNSSNDETKLAIEEANIKDNRFYYKKRNNIFSGIQHINTIHDEDEADYYMIFHDDDEMLPNMIEVLYNEIIQNESTIAVGAYSCLIKNGKKIQPSIPSQKEILDSPIKVIAKYASSRRNVSFPSYMYNHKILKQRLIIENGGKYSDCSFIVSLAKDGVIVHIPQVLMVTTIHEEQDSQDHQFSQYLTLTTYLKKIVGSKEKSKISYMRIFNIYNERVRQYRDFQRPLYSINLLLMLLKYSPTNFFPKYIIRVLGLYKK